MMMTMMMKLLLFPSYNATVSVSLCCMCILRELELFLDVTYDFSNMKDTAAVCLHTVNNAGFNSIINNIIT